MQAKSALQFLGYDVSVLRFKKTDAINEKGFQVTPRFKREVKALPDECYDVGLGILIRGSEESPIPFELCVELTGHFKAFFTDESEQTKKQLTTQNTVAILFPFLRSTVVSLTLAANIPPVLLPVINLAGAFEKNEAHLDDGDNNITE